MTSAVTASSSLGRLGSGSQQPTPSSRVTSALSLGGGAMSTRRRRQIAGGSVVMVLLTVSLIALLVWLLVIRPNALAADEARAVDGDVTLTDPFCWPGFCHNNGFCYHEGGQSSCNCTADFMGRRCSIPVRHGGGDNCLTGPCANGSECVNLYAGFYCKCAPGFTGTLCDFEIDECVTWRVQCQHSGLCIDLMANFTCVCTPSYTGTYCQDDIDECSSNIQPCLYCVNTMGSYTCSPCTFGLLGKFCDTDVDECQIITPSICANGATCTNTFGSYACACPADWRGYNCTVYTPNQGLVGSFGFPFGIYQTDWPNIDNNTWQAAYYLYGLEVNATAGYLRTIKLYYLDHSNPISSPPMAFDMGYGKYGRKIGVGSLWVTDRIPVTELWGSTSPTDNGTRVAISWLNVTNPAQNYTKSWGVPGPNVFHFSLPNLFLLTGYYWIDKIYWLEFYTNASTYLPLPLPII